MKPSLPSPELLIANKKAKQEEDPDFFLIDKHRLDIELSRHPKQVWKYGKELADAEAEHERAKAAKEIAKDELDEVEARINLAIRRDPAKYNLEKTTEDSVNKTVLLQKGYKEALQACYRATEKMIEAKHHRDICKAVMDTLEHKKPCLGKMVDLRMQEYYSDPKPSRGSRERMDKRERDGAFKRNNL